MREERNILETTLTVSESGQGIHARVATMIVRTLEKYSSQVTLCKDELEVDARSVLGLLLLAAEPGSEVTIRAQGSDCDEVVAEIGRIVKDETGQRTC